VVKVTNTETSESESKIQFTGKAALKVWNRVSEVLSEHGYNDTELSKAITARLVEDGLVEGEFFTPGLQHTGSILITKLHDEAVVPNFAHATDAGADLVSVENAVVPAYGRKMVGTGIAIAIPLGKVGLVHPRSGLAAKEGITVLNTPGTIDSGYRGEVKVILFNTTDTDYTVNAGERIAQLVIQNHDFPLLVEVSELPSSDRGVNGIGSTGKK